MNTRVQFEQHIGQWVRFRTKYGTHVGIVERVTPDSAILMSPRNHIPASLASETVSSDELERLDVALAWWGGGYPGGGYGGAGAYGRGYGGYGAYGWGRWAVSFLIIYALWGLFFW